MIDLNDAPSPAPAVRYDLDAIVARLRDRADDWVPQLFPNGRRLGDEWRLANIGGDPPRKNGSCVIALKGERAGDWHEFDGGQGGGPLSTIEQATGLTGRELFACAAELAGWSPAATPIRRELTTPTAQPKDHAREITLILAQAVPVAGTTGERYLRARGLALSATSDLLFHPDLVHWESRRGFPGLVAIVRDRSGQQVAIHRTYLSEDGGKAPVEKTRMMLGPVAGGSVRLAQPGENGVLGLAEGIETALAVMTACPALPVWATLSASNLEQVQLPPEVRRVVLLADHDASGAGQSAARAAALRLAGEGRRVWIVLPPREGDDFNDLLLREGADAVKAVVDAAVEWKREEPATESKRDDTAHKPIGFVSPSGPLPQLRADEGDLARAVQRTWNLLLASNRTPWLFRAAGIPSWIERDDDGLPIARTVTDERMRHILAQLADWRRLSRQGDLVPAHPPMPLIKSVLATPDPALPVLSGIVTAPVFGRNGALLTEPGYHPDARLLYRPPAGFVLPTVPERPTQAEIAAARSLIVDDMLGEFPFTSNSERAHAVALLLLGFVRAMIEGPTPLHLIEKPTPGTGATLMVDAIATVLTGVGASVMTEGRDEEEWRKRITAKLRQIPALVLIDNLRHSLDSSALAAALTAPYWEDRILGASDMTRLNIRCVWIATGNNPEFSNEMARRLVRIRLDARVDQPWRRDGFRHPDLMGWVRANRARLVAACLTLCRGWIAAGRLHGTKTIGSYEAWSKLMGGVLELAGVEGFLGNLDEMLMTADGEGAVWRTFVTAWWDRFGTTEVGTADLYEVAINAEPPLALGSGNDRSQRIRLGKALGRMRDRAFRLAQYAVRVQATGTHQGAQRWRLAFDEKTGAEKHSRHSPQGSEPVNVVNIGECSEGNIHERKPLEQHDNNQPGECGECSPLTYARAGARVYKGESGQHSPHSPHSPDPDKSRVSGGECAGECPTPHSPPSDPPAWLKEVL